MEPILLIGGISRLDGQAFMVDTAHHTFCVQTLNDELARNSGQWRYMRVLYKVRRIMCSECGKVHALGIFTGTQT